LFFHDEFEGLVYFLMPVLQSFDLVFLEDNVVGMEVGGNRLEVDSCTFDEFAEQGDQRWMNDTVNIFVELIGSGGDEILDLASIYNFLREFWWAFLENSIA
jgi:hypothetical protein